MDVELEARRIANTFGFEAKRDALQALIGPQTDSALILHQRAHLCTLLREYGAYPGEASALEGPKPA